MKQISVFSLTGFYLLLTTGMFACILNCSADFVLRNDGGFGSLTTEQALDEDMPCHQEEDHSCCKEQGSFVIKESITPDLQIRIPVNLYVIQLIHHADFSLNQVDSYSTFGRPQNDFSPSKDHIPIYLKVRSLII